MYGDIKTAKDRLGKSKKTSGILGRRAGGAKAEALAKSIKTRVVNKVGKTSWKDAYHHRATKSIKEYMDNEDNFKN